MKPTIRKTVTFIETTYIEGGRAPDVPVEMAGVAAVIPESLGGTRIC